MSAVKPGPVALRKSIHQQERIARDFPPFPVVINHARRFPKKACGLTRRDFHLFKPVAENVGFRRYVYHD